MEKNLEHELWAESIVSGRTFEPLVNVRLGTASIGQFTPEAARQYAGQLFEAAEAADSDAYVFKWLTRDIVGTFADDTENFERIMAEFKAFRDARRDPDRTKY